MIEVKEVLNGIEIRQTDITDVGYLSYNARPFFKSTNEDDTETYQILDTLGQFYSLPGLATDFLLIDINGVNYMPDNGTELIEYSYKLRPFRPEFELDRIISLGLVTATENEVNIALDGSGVNSVLIGGTFYEKYFPSVFSYTAVVEFQKILILYAKPDSTVFYLAQGIEAEEAVEPDYDGLFIARIIVSTSGEIIEVEQEDYKFTSSDNWRLINITTEDPYTIQMGNSLASSFEITTTADNPKIGLVRQKAGKSFWDGSIFRFFNNSIKDLEFTTETYTDTIFKNLTFEPFVLEAGLWCEFILKGGILVAEKTANPVDLSPYALDADVDAALALKADLVGGFVPSYQLPAYVDDILEFADFASFPATGESGKIYVAISPKNKQYRWTGSSYIQITNGLIASTDDVPEGSNIYFTTARVLATVLTGISFITGTAVVSTDSVLVAFGKLQKQITDALGSISLKLDKPLTPNNTSEFIINGDNTSSPKGNFQRTLQVEVSANTTAAEDWKGKEILVTASCTITIPATLSDSWSCDIGTLAGVTLNLAITTPKTWLFGTPGAIGEKTMFTICQRGNTNSIIIYGL